MKEQNDVVKLEFLLKLNENIVVQRYFNVRGYNPDARKSLDLIETIHDIIDDVKKDLTNKSCYYLLENYEQIVVDEEILNTSNTDGPENFYMTIKIGDETICQRGLDAKVYPPKVRYTVDVRPQLKKLLKDLTDIFSGENFGKGDHAFKVCLRRKAKKSKGDDQSSDSEAKDNSGVENAAYEK